MEEFFLRTFFASEKLDVIDQQEIRLAVTFPKLHQNVVLDRVDELVDKKLTRQVHHAAGFFLAVNILTDGLHQMRLPQPYPAIDEERVVGFCRRLGDGEARSMRDLIVRSNDERLKGIARIKPESACVLLSFGCRRCF